MNRPFFLTRTQRVAARARSLLLALFVLALFAFFGILFAIGVTS